MPKKSFLVICGLMLGMSVNAQYLRTSYFMEGTSSRLQLNPGLQPTRGYFNFPVIGSFNVGASSNVLGVEDIKDILDSGDNLFENDKLYDRLKDENHLNVNLNTDILSFGWYKGKGFWSFNVGLRVDVDASIEKNMFEYLRQVNRFEGVNTISDLQKLNGGFQNTDLNVRSWMEIGLGYSRPVTDKLTVGGRVKALLGVGKGQMKVNNFNLNVDYNQEFANLSQDQIYQRIANGDLREDTPLGTVKYTADAQVSTTVKGGGLKYNQEGNISGFDFKAEDAGVAGLGFGIDLGASYKVLDHFTVSAAVLDLGYINWKGSETRMATVNTTDGDVITAGNYQEKIDKYSSTDFLNMDRFNLKEDGQSHDSEKKKLASTIVLAGEYALLNNALSFGAMYTSRFVQPKTMNELTLSATLRPKNWFNVAFSYSPIMAAGKSMGVALKLGPVFLGTDYMFFGKNSQTVNGFVGISFPMGKKRASID